MPININPLLMRFKQANSLSLRAFVFGSISMLGVVAEVRAQAGAPQWERMVHDLQHQGWVADLEAIEAGSVLSAGKPEVELPVRAYSVWAAQLIAELEVAADADMMADQIIQSLQSKGMLRWRLLRTMSDRHRLGAERALGEAGLPAEWVQLPGVLTGWDVGYYGPGLLAGHWAVGLSDAAAAGLVVRTGLDERHRATKADQAAALALRAWTEAFPGDPVRQVVAWMRGGTAATAFSLEASDPVLLQALQRLRVLIQLDHNLKWEQSDALWLIRAARLDSCSCPNPWRLSALAEQGISLRWLQQENPWLTTDSISDRTPVALPPGSRDLLDLSKVCDPIKQQAQPTDQIIHTVQSGEVLGSIARKYGVHVSELRLWNGLQGDKIRRGQGLKLYGVEAIATVPQIRDMGNLPVSLYTVKSGDSLWGIASKYPGVSSDDLIELNQLKDMHIRPGQQLKIPQW
jgi:LysM repeat protein